MTAFPPDLATYLDERYSAVGALDAEIVFLYTDLRAFGRAASEFASRDDFFSAILRPLLDRGRTVLIPTFSYTTEGVFEVETTPSTLGAINRWIIAHPDALRSEHPLFSIAGLGPQANLVLDVGKSAFGARSVFERLIGRSASFLHVGRPVEIGNTCVHYVEQACGATYRYHKAFDTEVRRGGALVEGPYTGFMRRRDVPGHDFDFRFDLPVAELYDGLGVTLRGSNDDHTVVACYRYDRAIEFLTDAFERDPHVFIGGEYLETR